MPALHRAGTGGPVLPQDARAALDRVLASEAFRGAPQLSAFLSYVVDATLQGRQREIKGYTIATDAFGRDASFDPQADPIVRVEAMRLRRSLDSYYRDEGASDPVQIAIPRGSYVPTFAWRDAPDQPVGELKPRLRPDIVVSSAPPQLGPMPTRRLRLAGLAALAAAALIVLAALAARQVWRAPMELASRPTAGVGSFAVADVSLPTIEVLPFEKSGALPAWFSAEAFADRLLHALARFDEILVVNRTDPPETTAATRAPDVGRYQLSLRLNAAEGSVRALARLTNAASDEVVWAGEPPAVAEGQGAEFDLARDIATTLAQPYGVIFADVRTRPGAPPPARCIVAAYDYWPQPTAARHLAVRACLNDIIGVHPNFHLAHAALAYFAIEEYRSGFNELPGSPLDRALATAQRAVLLAPESARAQQALMAALFMRGDAEAAFAAGRRALEANPFDSDVLASVGSRYVALGRYDEGLPLLERAYEANSVRPPWYHFFMFLAAHMQGDDDRARRYAERAVGGDHPLGLVARIIAAQGAGDNQGRTEALRRLLEIAPQVGSDPSALFTRRSFAPEIVERLTQDLKRAGLEPRA